MEINGETAIGVIGVIIALQFFFGALKESGRLKAPKFGRKSHRQHPPVQGGEEFEY